MVLSDIHQVVNFKTPQIHFTSYVNSSWKTLNYFNFLFSSSTKAFSLFSSKLSVCLQLSNPTKLFKMTAFYRDFFKTSIKSLKLFGIWIDGDLPNLRNVVLILYHLLFSFTIVVFEVLYIVKTEIIIIEGIIDVAALMPSIVAAFFRIIYFIHKKKEFVKLLSLLEDLVEFQSWIENSDTNLTKRSDQIIKILKFYAGMAVTTWAFFTVISFLNTELSWKMWLPFDYSKNQFTFLLTLIWQQSMIFIPFTVSFFLEVMPSILLNFTVGLTEELGSRIEKIGWEVTEKKKIVKFESSAAETNQAIKIVEIKEEKALKELLVCIEIQLKIKNIVDGISDIFGKVIWMQGFLSTVILCTTSYALTVVSLSMLFNLMNLLIFLLL